MQKPSVKCALLATLIAKHKWGTPITKEDLLSLSAIDGDYPTARDVYVTSEVSRTSLIVAIGGSNSIRVTSVALLTFSITSAIGRHGR